MGRQTKQHVYGGLYIPIAAGLTKLYDILTETDTTQLLITQAKEATPTLFITLNHPVKTFKLKTVTVGYVDGAAADDLANVRFFEGAVVSDELSFVKQRYETGALAEGNHNRKDIDIDMRLDTKGKVWFSTAWTTQVINCGAAGEYLFIRIDGETEDHI